MLHFHLNLRFFVAFPLLSPSIQPYLKLEMNLECDVKFCNLILWRRLDCVNKKKKKTPQTEIGRVGGGRKSSCHTTPFLKRQSWAKFSFQVYESTSKHASFYKQNSGKLLLYIINPTEYYKIYFNRKSLAGLTYMNSNPIFASTLFLL